MVPPNILFDQLSLLIPQMSSHLRFLYLHWFPGEPNFTFDLVMLHSNPTECFLLPETMIIHLSLQYWECHLLSYAHAQLRY